MAEQGTCEATPVTGAPTGSLSVRRLVAVTLFGFGIVYYWSALTSILLPEQIMEFATEATKGKILGFVTAAGSVVLILLEPVAGVMSDRCQSPSGKRKPFIFWGTMGMAVTLVLLFLAPNLVTFILIFIVLKVFWSFAEGTFPALIPDTVPESQRGRAAGLLGVLQLLGASAGAYVTGKVLANADTVRQIVPLDPLLVSALVTVVVLVVCALIVKVGVRETPQPPAPRAERSVWIEAFEVRPLLRERALLWLTVSRTFWYFGFVTVQTLLLFFVKDVLLIQNYADATANLFSILFMAALPTVFLAGWWSDRVGLRKPFIYFSSALMIIAALFFVGMDSYSTAMVAMALWGLGGGIFISTSMAMATESFPEAGSNARYLALWMVVSQSVPWMIAPLIGGAFMDWFGFRAVFVFVILCFVTGTILFYRVSETGWRAAKTLPAREIC